MGELNTRGVPTRGVWLVSAIGAAGLFLGFVNDWGTEDIVNIPASLVLVTYPVGAAASADPPLPRGRAPDTGSVYRGRIENRIRHRNSLPS